MGQDEKEERAVESVRQILERAWEIQEERNAAPYDGVLGQPPVWCPPQARESFFLTRNRLLDTRLFGEKVSPRMVLDWINAYADLGELKNGEVASTTYIPPEVETDVGRLANLRYAFGLGPVEGRRYLGGEDAVKGLEFRQSQTEKAKKRRGRIGEGDQSTTISEIINGLANENRLEECTARELWPEFFSKLESLHLNPKEIGDAVIEYDVLLSGECKSITFKRFENAVSQERASRKSR